MDHVTFLGMLAASCTTIAFIPQAYKVYKTKHTSDLSRPMYIIFSAGTFLWLAYGITIKSLPIICANTVTFLLSVYILAMMIGDKGGKR